MIRIFLILMILVVQGCGSESQQSHQSPESPKVPENVDDKLTEIPLNWDEIIQEFGGAIKDAGRFPQTAQGFVDFARLSGVNSYDPLQIITPPNKAVAKKCKINYLLPERSKWKKGIAIALWAEELGKIAGEQPSMLNWYRSPCYNKGVGGAKYSDHMAADSADLDFIASSSRRRAQGWLCDFWKSRLNMQIGLGGSMVHLGAMSPRGRRNWYYATYKDSDRGNTCFDKGSKINQALRWFSLPNDGSQPLFDEDSHEDLWIDGESEDVH